ncbi:MAG: hypothetical protein GY842_22750 [bacterium]|nr:hypothetical protein [bacterium]
MFGKRSLIVTLVGANLLLAAALILSLDLLPSAYAQRGGRPGDFAVCTVKIHEDYDAIYIIDQQKRHLHCFMPSRAQDGTLTYVSSRDLASDVQRTN